LKQKEVQIGKEKAELSDDEEEIDIPDLAIGFKDSALADALEDPHREEQIQTADQQVLRKLSEHRGQEQRQRHVC
jgi:hypothetical protein